MPSSAAESTWLIGRPSGPGTEATNASRLPSGANTGLLSSVAPGHMRRSPDPSAAMTQRVRVGTAPRANAIDRPSGDQAGVESGAGSSVRRVRPPPSGATA